MVLSVNPISWIKDFKLAFVSDVVLSGGESMLNWIVFFGQTFISLIVLFGMGFPSRLSKDDCRLSTQLLVGFAVTVGGLRF